MKIYAGIRGNCTGIAGNYVRIAGNHPSSESKNIFKLMQGKFASIHQKTSAGLKRRLSPSKVAFFQLIKRAKIKGYLLEFPGMSQKGEQQCSLCYSAKQT